MREAVEAGRPFLGVCLGVQLLAAALGARVYEAERPEVGLLEVELTAEGRDDPLFAGRRRPARSPCSGTATPSTCPTGAVRLASSPRSPNQAFRVGERAYGVQFHLEVTGEMAARVGADPGLPRVARARRSATSAGAAFIADVERRAGELHPPARRLFANWLELAGAPA